MESIIEQFSQKMATINSAINSLGRFDMNVWKKMMIKKDSI